MSETLIPASLTAWWNGALQRSSRSAVSCWNCARVSFSSRCSGPSADARDVGQVDRGLGRRGQFDLGLLGGLAQPLHRHLVLGQVDAVGVLELLDQVVDDPLVPVVAAQVGVAVGGLDLDDALADLQQRDVEGAAAEVEDQDGLVVLLVQAVGQGGGRRLVDDPQHLQAGDLAGLLGRGALGVVEVRGNGDDRVRDVLAEVRLGVALELLQHPRGDLLRGVLLAVDVAALRETPLRLAHVALDRPRGAVDVGHRLPFGDLADQHLAVLGEGDHRRGGPGALGVGDDRGLTALQHADHRVRRTKVDTDCTCHGLLLVLRPTPGAAPPGTGTRRHARRPPGGGRTGCPGGPESRPVGPLTCCDGE